jgi:guanylate kinase
MEENRKGTVIVLSGFSGAGKGTIMKHLLNTYPDKYFLSVSATTREKRTEKRMEENISSYQLKNLRI